MKAWIILTRVGTFVLVTARSSSEAQQTFVDNGALESDIIECKGAQAGLCILMDTEKGGY